MGDRLVGSLKLQVSFAEYRLFHRALLQKRPIILMSLLLEAAPYERETSFEFSVLLCFKCVSVCQRKGVWMFHFCVAVRERGYVQASERVRERERERLDESFFF